MPNTTQITEQAPGSLVSQMLNVFASPGEVFDEVIAKPARPATWLFPLLVVCLAGIFVVRIASNAEQGSSVTQELLNAGQIAVSQAETMNRQWPVVSIRGVCLVVAMGTLWSAVIIWCLGRFFLKVRFPFSKALAVVTLSEMILALNSVVTGLLILASGDGTLRPDLSVLAPKMAPENQVIIALGILNPFHLWSMCVLGIGLARLAVVSLKESLFWVMGYWLVLRLGLVLLA